MCRFLCPRGGCVLIKAHHVQSVEGVLGASSYQNNKVNQWTSSVVEQCLNQLTKLQKPFKYIGRLIQGGKITCLFHLSLSLSLPPSPSILIQSSNMCDNAEEWSWPTHCQFLLLGQLNRWYFNDNIN